LTVGLAMTGIKINTKSGRGICNDSAPSSTALFMNNLTASNILKALHIFWKEKQQSPDYSKTLNYERRYEKRRNKQIKFIKARELSKKNDWNTVK